MAIAYRLDLQAFRDPAPRQIIRGNFQNHSIARQNPDVVHPEFSGDVPQNRLSRFKLYSELSVRQRFNNLAF